MGLSNFLFKVLHWRWSPAIGLLVAGLLCPLLIWIAVAALLRDLEGPLVALREVDRVLARSPTVTENDEAYIPPQSTSPGPRRALAGRDSRPDSQATQNERGPVVPALPRRGRGDAAAYAGRGAPSRPSTSHPAEC